MKTSFFSFLLFFTASFFSSNAAAQTDNQATFEAFLQSAYTAFEKGGNEGIRAFYTRNAGEIGPDGRLANGLAAIEANWAEMEKMLEARPKFTYQLTSWRLIGPDVAIITWDSEDEFTMQGQTMKFKNTASAVLRKEGGKWLIEFDQLTPKMDYSMPDQEADIAAIQALGREAYAAFEARDAARFAACYTEDADFVSPYGQSLKGRKMIEQAHAELFKAWEKMPKSGIKVGEPSIRFISPDLAVCQWGHHETMAVEGKAVNHEATFLDVCQRVDGKWLVTGFSITPVAATSDMAGH